MEEKKPTFKMKLIPNGPIMVEGPLELTLADGSVVEKDKAHLCRCGASKNKPYCDGSHAKVGFKD